MVPRERDRREMGFCDGGKSAPSFLICNASCHPIPSQYPHRFTITSSLYSADKRSFSGNERPRRSRHTHVKERKKNSWLYNDGKTISLYSIRYAPLGSGSKETAREKIKEGNHGEEGEITKSATQVPPVHFSARKGRRECTSDGNMGEQCRSAFNEARGTQHREGPLCPIGSKALGSVRKCKLVCSL